MTTDPDTQIAALADDPALARQLAADPATHPQVLTYLADVPDDDVRELVTANPNTPESVLQQAASEFPQAFLANPVLPLLLLADPAYVTHLNPRAVLGLLRLEAIPQLVLRGNHSSQDVQSELAMHVARAGEVQGDWWLAVCTVLRRDMRGRFCCDFCTLPGIFPPWFFDILQDGNGLVSASPDAPVTLLAHYGQERETRVLRMVARHPRTPAATLGELALAHEVTVRCAVANNTALSFGVLYQLARDADARVRRAVAYHPKTDPSDLALLAQDVDEKVRRAALQHPKLSAAAHATPELPVPESPAIEPMEHVASFGKSAPLPSESPAEDIPRYLDPSTTWYWPLRREPPATLAELITLLHASESWVAYAISIHPATPPAVCAAAMNINDIAARMKMAANKRTPIFVLEALAGEENAAVQMALARNPHTPFAVLEHLAEVADAKVLHAVVHHPHVSRVRRQALYERFFVAKVPLLPKMLNRTSLSHDDAHLLVASATMREHPAHLQRYSRSFSWVERFMVAMNPHAPPATLESLTHDGNRYIRAAARQTLAQQAADTPASPSKKDS